MSLDLIFGAHRRLKIPSLPHLAQLRLAFVNSTFEVQDLLTY
jgi:hypothetical protein